MSPGAVDAVCHHSLQAAREQFSPPCTRSKTNGPVSSHDAPRPHHRSTHPCDGRSMLRLRQPPQRRTHLHRGATSTRIRGNPRRSRDLYAWAVEADVGSRARRTKRATGRRMFASVTGPRGVRVDDETWREFRMAVVRNSSVAECLGRWSRRRSAGTVPGCSGRTVSRTSR
jgi:hypothetical protein